MTMPAISKHLVADCVEGYRLHWEQRFDRLDAYLEQIQTKDTE